jgi:NAD-dependent dihydropyrimidine dehydrogenase PreA subunit
LGSQAAAVSLKGVAAMTTTQDRPPAVTVPRRSPTTARWLRLARHTTQAVVAGIVVWQVSNEFSGGKAEGICPFGGFETIWTWLTTGRLVSHIRPANLAVGVTILVMALAGRSFFCGWACPMGAIQGAIHTITSAVVDRIGPLRRLRRRVERAAGRPGGFARSVDRLLRYGRHLVLGWALIGASVTATMVWREYDPWHALISVAEFEFSTAFVVLLLVAVVSMVVRRPFCRYACPLGALQGVAAKVSPLAVQRNADACLGCDLCNRACPVGIEVNQLTRVTDSNCLGCLECVAACPSREALGVSLAFPLPARPAAVPPPADVAVPAGLSADRG